MSFSIKNRRKSEGFLYISASVSADIKLALPQHRLSAKVTQIHNDTKKVREQITKRVDSCAKIINVCTFILIISQLTVQLMCSTLDDKPTLLYNVILCLLNGYAIIYDPLLKKSGIENEYLLYTERLEKLCVLEKHINVHLGGITMIRPMDIFKMITSYTEIITGLAIEVE